MKNISPLSCGSLFLLSILAIGTLQASQKNDIGDAPVNISHTVYKGSYGKKQGIYVIQWIGDRIRGSFIDLSNHSEIPIYGDNSKQGQIIFEVWDPTYGEASGSLVKIKHDGVITWAGTLHVTERLSIPLAMHKFTPPSSGDKASHSVYTGLLGASTIQVELDWFANGKVQGHYKNLKTGKSYPLKGYNYDNGKIYLDEWDPHFGKKKEGVREYRGH